MKTLDAGRRACKVKRSYLWHCTLPPGGYSLRVYATDLAGNSQAATDGARLTAK